MRQTIRPPILDARVRAAWQTQLAAVKTPVLLPELMRRHELPPRFGAYYAQLRGLPRRVRRALQRQWRLPLAGIALMLALGQSPGLAATISVGDTCTLVDAITAANTDTATGGCPAGNGADTIVLPASSTQTLTEVNNETYGPTGLPVISSVVTIAGQGSTIVRDSETPLFRLLAVSSVGDLTLQETTVSGGGGFVLGNSYSYTTRGGGMANFGGSIAVTDSTISGNSVYSHGGGVYNAAGGTLTITNSTISDNYSRFLGGGVENYGTLTITNSTISGNAVYDFGGGGVANYGTLTITNSTISGNAAIDGNGGGVLNLTGGLLTITNSTISDNRGFYFGGGVSNRGTLTITNSTMSGNRAIYGGGVSNRGTLTITNSTISNNNSSYRSARGGGVYNTTGGLLTITNSTITGNTTDYAGGGVANDGTLTITNSTIAGNTVDYAGGGEGGGLTNHASGTLRLSQTLVAGNTASVGPEIVNRGRLLANNHNLFGVDGTAGVVGFRPGGRDVVPPAGVLLPDILDPALAFHGGPTQTHALVPGSPAIDAGGRRCLDANGGPLSTDQRGEPRVVDGNGDGKARCDIGAFEFFPVVNDFVTLAPAPETSFDPTPVPNGRAGTFTITATFTNTSDTPLRFPFFTVTELSGGNLLLNAQDGAQGVGATLTPAVGDGVLAPGERVAVDFVIGLQDQARFTFFVELFGEPVP